MMKTILAYLQEMESRGDEKAKRLLSQYKAKNALSNIKEYPIGKIFEKRKDFETVCGLSTFIVVASFTESKTPVGYNLKDFWSSHDEIETAEVTYKNHLQRDDLYSASICRVITSTDYD